MNKFIIRSYLTQPNKLIRKQLKKIIITQNFANFLQVLDFYMPHVHTSYKDAKSYTSNLHIGECLLPSPWLLTKNMYIAFLKAFLTDDRQHDSIEDPIPAFSILTVNSLLLNLCLK